MKKAYIGFWKDGKQHGFGKFITSQVTFQSDSSLTDENLNIKYGKWENGKRSVWYEETNLHSIKEFGPKSAYIIQKVVSIDLNTINSKILKIN